MATPGQPTSCKPACNELAHNGCRPGAANAVPGDFFGVSRALCRVIAPKREYSVAMASENSIDCLTSNDFAVGGINTSLILHRVRNRATVSAGPFSSRLKSL